ncbi:MAG: hypothetical protein ACK5QU_03520 [Bacteroidota bacterium]
MKCRENALSVKTIGGLRTRRSIAGDLIYWLCGRRHEGGMISI